MAISMYDVHAREKREAAHTAYIADPQFPALAHIAATRGFRKATIGEIHASAERTNFARELYSWRGGLWLPIAAEARA
jgi:hypothetical protein